nr:carboxypeptidase regulatory-like domain-containing protein [Chitinophagaceae bacterium]
MLIKKFLPLIIAAVAFPFLMKAQVTTSSMGGVIRGSDSEPLAGATITATHIPTGTVYRVISRNAGQYDINNMTPGGPYNIVSSFVGYDDEKQDEIFLSLGEKGRYDFLLARKAANLTEVVISGRRAAAQAKGGTETNIGRDKIQNMPTVSR